MQPNEQDSGDVADNDEEVLQEQTPAEDPLVPFQIVGMGASAGGLAAIEAFFTVMPPDSGMAFVLVTHLAHDQVSLLPELLQKNTKMPVRQISGNELVEPNCIYTNPPNADVRLQNGHLHLSPPAQPLGHNLPIDFFLESLAVERGASSIAIILSGTGRDGTIGAQAIREALGIVMVQSPASCAFDGMPRSIINAGIADYTMAPEELPARLVAVSGRFPSNETSTLAQTDSTILEKIFALLRHRTNHDFSGYKSNTMSRRIERRMNVHQIDRIEGYLHYLRESSHEVDCLFDELLISVTSFFRDPAAFEALQSEAIPRLLKDRNPDLPIRVWVAGCATGEEAYSLAIMFHECMEQMEHHFQLAIFATDIDAHAIDVARRGRYPANITSQISAARLRRYFTKTEDGDFLVKKMIRESIVFAEQNLIRDPPFTRLDLVSCRNLLVYFQPTLQQRLIPIFHYSLMPDGLLFLGSSETIGPHGDLFEPTHKQWKLYRKKNEWRREKRNEIRSYHNHGRHNPGRPKFGRLDRRFALAKICGSHFGADECARVCDHRRRLQHPLHPWSDRQVSGTGRRKIQCESLGNGPSRFESGGGIRTS